MHWQWIVGAGTVASGSVALLTFLASLPFSPARFWTWRVRKQMETVNALDPERHKALREVLLRKADELAGKAAAAQRIPTHWVRNVIGSVVWMYAITATIVLPWAWSHHEDLPKAFGDWFMIIAGVLLGYGFAYRATVVYVLHNRRERARFIQEGCPANFVVRPTLHERERAAQVINVFLKRELRRMERAGKPPSRLARGLTWCRSKLQGQSP